MTTETTTAAPDTTQAATDTGATTEATTTTTVLGGGEGEGNTAGDVEAGKGAEAATDDGKGEGKPEDGKSDPEAKTDGPPEKYEFTMPEGVELDAALAEQVEPVFRDIGLSQDQANKLTSAFAEYRVSEAQRQSEAYAQQVEDWGKAARDDKEYGGTNFGESAKMAQQAISTYGSPELKTLLQEGLGNHPELIRFCVRVGKAMAEDSGVTPGTKTPASKDAKAILFDHPTSQPKR